jgi:D-aspartate ligase
VTQRLACPRPEEAEQGFIDVLLDFGRRCHERTLVVPTGDDAALALSKHRRELEGFYHLPVPDFETASVLVNKKAFYQLLAEMGVPHPTTYYPQSPDEIKALGREIDYPYILKPASSADFQREFGRKCFVIRSARELESAVHRLGGSKLEVMVQKIIPGRTVYTFLAYMNRESQPLAVCGWDKLRHYPPGFGNGTLCESVSRPSLEERGIRFLQAIGYCGFAAPEYKLDPADGEYKLLEVNPRTTLANGLAEACGVDIAYAAYLDAMGCPADPPAPRSGVAWVDDLVDLVSLLANLRRGEVGAADVCKTVRPGKVHSVLAWDDPVPFIARGAELSFRGLQLLLGRS